MNLNLFFNRILLIINTFLNSSIFSDTLITEGHPDKRPKK